MPCRDPSPALQHPSIAGSSAASPHATVLHEGGDQEKPDPQPEDQHHPSIFPAGPDDELTEGYETASTGLASVTSSVYAHAYENGRRYQHFKNGRYPIPNDDEELAREDLKHAMLMELCDSRLFYAPIKNPHNILDIGTGSGIWAIDIGDEFPNAHVRGIDLSPYMPVWAPPNVEFLIDDCEQGEWVDQDTDFVHFRFMTIVLKDVPGVLSYVYQSLKPGG